MASKRDQKKIRELKDAASQAMRKNRPKDAAAAYAKLEALEPKEGQWAQRMADAQRRLGNEKEEVAALERAADRWADGGFLLKGIAACKMVLELRPQHTRIQESLTQLYASRGLSAPGEEAEIDSAGTVESEGSGLERGRPLEEIVLTEMVTTEDASDLKPADETSRFSEVPLDWDHEGWLADEEGGLPPELEVTAKKSGPEARAAARKMLPQVPLFSLLAAPALRQLIDGVALVSLHEGETLFEEGDLGDALYVVAEGAVVPIAKTEDGQPKRMAVLEEGSFFGETALLANQPRNAGIEALVETNLLAIDRGILTDMLDKDREMLCRLLEFFRDRLVERLVQTSRFFSTLPTSDRRELVESFRFLEVQPGSQLVQQGSTAPALYVLLAGAVEVVRKDEDGDDRSIADLQAGHVFGEMSILQGDAAMSSCHARTKCWLLALGRKEVVALMARCPAIHEAAMSLADERRELNEGRSPEDTAPAFDENLNLI